MIRFDIMYLIITCVSVNLVLPCTPLHAPAYDRHQTQPDSPSIAFYRVTLLRLLMLRSHLLHHANGILCLKPSAHQLLSTPLKKDSKNTFSHINATCSCQHYLSHSFYRLLYLIFPVCSVLLIMFLSINALYHHTAVIYMK